MKKFLHFSLVSALLLSLGAFTSQSKSSLPKINKNFLIHLHIFTGEDSTTKLTQSDFDSYILGMNEAFSPIGVSFSVCETDTIYNKRYSIPDNEKMAELSQLHSKTHRINLFIVDSLTDACGIAQLAGIENGITSPGMGSIFIKEKNCGIGTFVHEMGHFFGLKHTFEAVNDNVKTSELADGSNCSNTGDGICDTPADPYINPEPDSLYIDGNCRFIFEEKDANGDYYNPLVNNYMSYYDCACNSFTDGQFRKMVETYNLNKTAW